MIYLQLFLSFVQIGMFSFGGGYASMPLIVHQVVDINHWISMAEFTDLITISQMTPGPIAINAATFIGSKVAGFGGSVAATFGCILPSCIIVSLLAHIYFKYKGMSIFQGALTALRPAVVAMIASAGLSIIISAFWGGDANLSFPTLKISMVIIFAIAIFLLRFKNFSPVAVMVLCGVLNTVLYFITSYF